MSNFLIEGALHIEGFNDEQIAQIEGAIPELTILVAAYHGQQARIARLLPVLEMILQVYNQQKGK